MTMNAILDQERHPNAITTPGASTRLDLTCVLVWYVALASHAFRTLDIQTFLP